MKNKIPSRRLAKGLLTALALLLLPGVTQAAVTTTFGESVPATNIITSYEPVPQDALTWLRVDGTNRIVSQSFITPGDSDYSVTGITHKLNATLDASFLAPSPFTIDFYSVVNPALSISSPGNATFVETQSGSMQPTTGVALGGTYFTFNLDTPLTIEAGVSYAYVLAFTETEDYNILRMSISNGAPNTAGSRAFFLTNGGGWDPSGETYVYYIQGTAVPEPGIVGLLATALLGGLIFRHRARRTNTVAVLS